MAAPTLQQMKTILLRLQGRTPKQGSKGSGTNPSEEARLRSLVQRLDSAPVDERVLRELISATYRTGRYAECKLLLDDYVARGFRKTPFVERTRTLLQSRDFIDLSAAFDITKRKARAASPTPGRAAMPTAIAGVTRLNRDTPLAERADQIFAAAWSDGLDACLSGLESPAESWTRLAVEQGDGTQIAASANSTEDRLILIEVEAPETASPSAGLQVRARGGERGLSVQTIWREHDRRAYAAVMLAPSVRTFFVTLHTRDGARITNRLPITAWEGTVSDRSLDPVLSENDPRLSEVVSAGDGEGPKAALDRLSSAFLSSSHWLRAASIWLAERQDELIRSGEAASVIEWLLARDAQHRVAYDVASALYFQQKQLRLPARIARAIIDAGGAKISGQRRERLERLADGALLLAWRPLVPERRPPVLESVPGKVLSVLHQCMPFDTNGYAVRSHHLSRAVQASGWTVLCAPRVGYPKTETPVEKRQTHEGLTYVFTPGADLNEVSDWRYIHGASDAMSRLVLAERPQVVHAASGYANAWPALIAARRYGLPFIYEIRGFWEMSMAAAQPWLADSDRAKILARNDTLIAGQADAVLVLTEAMKAELVGRGIKPDRILVVPNAVDAKKLVPVKRDTKLAASLGLRPGVPTVGYAGSLVDYEGLDLLISALGALRRDGVDFNLLIVGDGAARAKLEHMAGEIGLVEGVCFTGRVPNEAVGKHYGLMDICPFPRMPVAVCEHVPPLKPFEAMARGKAVLTSDVAPMEEFIVPGVNGQSFAKGDEAALAEALRAMLGDPAAVKALGERAREWVKSHRTWTDSAAVVIKGYEHALAEALPGQGEAAPPMTLAPRSGLESRVILDAGGWVTVAALCAPVVDVVAVPTLAIDVLRATGKSLTMPARQALDAGLWRDEVTGAVQARAVLSGWSNRARARFYLPPGEYTLRVAEDRTFACLMLGQMSVSIDPEREPRPAGERLRIALIADTFTTAALGGAADCTLLSRKTYRQQIEEGEFDLFVCESAWEGPGGEWRRGVGWYSEQEFSDLKTVLALFRKRGVAAVFFNKEDPVHFDRFSRTAAHFDHVVTTDAHMVPRYLGLPDSRILTAEARPFFADPHTHHPFGDALRDDVICYAGTYYGARYPERTRHLAPLLEEASRHNLVIYDRQSLLPDSPYPLPAELKSHAAGGLSYEEMLQAYRRHAVFLNVNSVEKSPTMFSRRVVEALASGAAVISGPGAAIGEQFHGVIPVVSTADEARTVLGDVADDPAYRESLAAAGARVVLSRHLASHWLGAVAARAGLHHAGAFAPPSYAAVVTLADDVDTDMLEAALDGLFHQSLPPVEVRVARDEQWAQQHFGDRILNWRRWADEAGVAFSISTSATPPEADYVVTIDPRAWYGTHCFQDLLNLAAFGPADRIGKGAWVDLDALERRRFVTQGGDSELKREVELDTRCVLRRVGTPETETRGVSGNLLSFQPTAPNRGLRRMLVAGHDLKFIRPYFPHFEAAGYEIMVDEWKGHDRTEQAEARRLLEKADVIFCEWMLGNARWYARNVRPHQTLVCRFHRQELETRFPKDLDIERFHRVFFVGAETRDQALTRFQWTPDSRFVVTGNGVDIEALDRPKLASARFTLGLVGMVPSLKRVDRALDILAALRARDPRFHLRIKGKRPSEYAWLAKNPSEMEYFKRFWDRLKNDPLVSGAVHLDPHGPDMAEWYTRIGFVLSTSTLESFHMTVADGAASRAVPVVLPWAGAEAIYGPQWLHSDTDSAASKIAELAVDEQHWQTEGDTAQAAIAQRYDLTHVADRIIRHLRMDDFERIRPLHLPRH